MNETKEDAFGRKVIIAVNRGKRPNDFKRKGARPGKDLEYDAKCFFCPGNEHMTPPEIARREEEGKWIFRCFPNKFYAVSREFENAYGTHEVIVETEKHNLTLSQLSRERILKVLEMYKERVKELYKDGRIRYALVFKNEGGEAGASLTHSHTQIMCMDYVPKKIAEETEGECVFCRKIKEKKNLVYENASFVALCPEAPIFPFETWIIDRKHEDFLECDLKELADGLKNVLAKLDTLLDFPPYNFYFHIAPKNGKMHFHIELITRLSNWAGFEFGSGVIINVMPPEQAAEALRNQKIA